MTLAEEIRALETNLLEPRVRASSERLDDLLAEDFVEHGSSGRSFDKKQIVELLGREEPLSNVSLLDFRVRDLGPGLVLATYRARVDRGAGAGASWSLRASIWGRDEGRWRLRFHQGTPTAPPDEA